MPNLPGDFKEGVFFYADIVTRFATLTPLSCFRFLCSIFFFSGEVDKNFRNITANKFRVISVKKIRLSEKSRLKFIYCKTVLISAV